MENASKALLIAAAVLIVILLIAFGMQIFNSASSSGDQVQGTADSMAIQSFNAQFTGYEGSKKSARDVRTLLSVIQASNAANPTHQVKPSTTTKAASVDDSKTYTVSCTYATATTTTANTEAGYIYRITIKPNS